MESVGDGGGCANSGNTVGVSTLGYPTKMHGLCIRSLYRNRLTGIRVCAPTDSIVLGIGLGNERVSGVVRWGGIEPIRRSFAPGMAVCKIYLR